MSKIEKLIIPKGIRFISDWKEYNLKNYPFPHILDKKLTGCGFTEYCIRPDNPLNVILCSPRKILLENKEDQHKGEVWYAKNESELFINFERDLSLNKADKSSEKAESLKKIQESLLKLKKGIRDWFEYCKETNRPCKILVTYDSFRHVREELGEEVIKDFHIIIDEFQSIFTDSRFKSSSEIEFLSSIKGLKKVCYVSATPMMHKYLNMLDEFKDLPYFELDWSTEDPGRVIKPILNVKFLKRLAPEADRIIQNYLDGIFEEYTYSDFKTVKSKEAVLYFNSVKSICDIIRRNKLTLDQVNVLCADTIQNRQKLRKAFGDHLAPNAEVIGKIPKKGEPHKMFTLCTRTVYLGSDFYSTNARSFIFSDSRIDCLSVDISMDLNQILGRQRLKENPWKNEATLIVRIDGKLFNEEDFNNYIKKKEKATQDLLISYDISPKEIKHSLADAFLDASKLTAYKKNYVSVNCHAGSDLLPVFNKLVEISELRTFEIQQKDYRDRFSLMNSIESNCIGIKEDELESFLKLFNEKSSFEEKMRLICTYQGDTSLKEKMIKSIPAEYRRYYEVLGPKKILSKGCEKKRVHMEYLNEKLLSTLTTPDQDPIYQEFKVGERDSLKNLKNRLIKIYQEKGIDRVPMATDLSSHFKLKRINLKDENNKRVEGFELLPLAQDS